jgi:hypothetical protein
MESLKTIGLACRLHYEKILLSLMLIILAVAVLYLYDQSQKEQEKIKVFITDIARKSTKPVGTGDITRVTVVMRLAQNPPALNFSLPHNLFNPVKWQRTPDGSFVKIQTGKEVGPDRMTVARIAPLNFIISLDRVASAGGYFLGVTHEAAERPLDRKKKQTFATLNAKTPAFILREAKGPPEDPTELVLELTENNERVSVFKDKPYSVVEGYEADLKYTVDNKAFNNLRVGSPVRFGGEDYRIVAINEKEVVLLAANDKKYTVKLAAAQ